MTDKPFRPEVVIHDIVARSGPVDGTPEALFLRPGPKDEAESLCLASWAVAKLRSIGSCDAAQLVGDAAAHWSCSKCGVTEPSVGVTDGPHGHVMFVCPVCNRDALMRRWQT